MILRGKLPGEKLLIAGWGVNVGMLYGSFFSKIGPDTKEFQTNIEPTILVGLIGLAFVTAIIGLIWLIIIGNKATGV